jgi:putative flippase GtrA
MHISRFSRISRISRISNGTGRVFREILRFLVVGGVATLVSVIGFNALVHGTLLGTAPLGQHPISAYVLVNVVGGCVAYLGMRLWAFSHREVSDSLASVVNFFALGALTMVIPVLCLAISRYVLGLSNLWADNISANVVGLTLGTATRFWVFRRYVFLDVAQPVPESHAA